jgi:hypothetical protein
VDVEVTKIIEVQLTLNEAEIWGLRDLVKGAEEYFLTEGVPITEVQAKIIGSVMGAIEQVRK